MPSAPNQNARRKAFVESCLIVIEERAKTKGSLFGDVAKDAIARLGTLQEKNRKLLSDCACSLARLGDLQEAAADTTDGAGRVIAAASAAGIQLREDDGNVLMAVQAVLAKLSGDALEKIEANRKLVARTQIVWDTNETTIAMLRAVERVKGCIRKLAETEPDRLVGGLRDLARQIRTADELRRKSRAQTCHYLDTYGEQNVESVPEGVETVDPRKEKTAIDIDFENLAEMAKEIRNLS